MHRSDEFQRAYRAGRERANARERDMQEEGATQSKDAETIAAELDERIAFLEATTARQRANLEEEEAELEQTRSMRASIGEPLGEDEPWPWKSKS